MISRTSSIVIAVFLLIFVQQLTMLVEAIYMLNLLHTSMDARALAVLFLYGGLFLLFFKTAKVGGARVIAVLFVLFSVPGPWMTTEWRIYTAGIAVLLFLLLLGLGAKWAASSADWFFGSLLATMLSVALRLFDASQDVSLVGVGRILGALFAVVGIYLFFKKTDNAPPVNQGNNRQGAAARRTIAAVGFFSSLFFLYALLFSPAVVSRWTAVDYRLIHVLFVLSSLTLVWLGARNKGGLPASRGFHIAWNFLFIAALVFILLHNRIHFPETAASPVFVADAPDALNILATLAMLSLSPVIFMNLAVFRGEMQTDKPRRLALPIFLGGVLFSLLIFMLIFTNVWGYVGEASRVFRNKFYLPFLLAGLGMMPALFIVKSRAKIRVDSKAATIASLLGVAIVVVALACQPAPKAVSPKETLTVMTYNIQQGVDYRGAKNYEKQLSVIRRVDPDILCLQESDVARISGGNSDVVRFFAQKLNYFSYYGPNTVTGTFGTAILSRLPLEKCKTIFTWSDVDETGTAYAEFQFAGRKIGVFNNHPAGGASAHQAHIDMLCREVQGRDNVLALGDFNFRPGSSYYGQIAELLSDAWSAAWPDGVGDMGALGIRRGEFETRDSNGRWVDETHLAMPDRIDHIFVGRDFKVMQAACLPAPESQSDHPAHWAVLKYRGSDRACVEGDALMSISEK